MLSVLGWGKSWQNRGLSVQIPTSAFLYFRMGFNLNNESTLLAKSAIKWWLALTKLIVIYVNLWEYVVKFKSFYFIGEFPHRCTTCGKGFSRRQGLVSHMHQNHSVESRPKTVHTITMNMPEPVQAAILVSDSANLSNMDMKTSDIMLS